MKIMFKSSFASIGIVFIFFIMIQSDSQAQTIGLHVDPAHNVLFGDSLGGVAEESKLIWLSSESAFRAGKLATDSVGLYSASFGRANYSYGWQSMSWGLANKALGQMSTAFGNGTWARGGHSTAFGFSTEASGHTSTSWGQNNYAIGEASTTWGGGKTIEVINGMFMADLPRENYAKGNYSTVWGTGNTATSYNETILGIYADTTVNNDFKIWEGNHQLFAIGNGDDFDDRNNALTVLKNGNIGVNTSSPDALMHIESNQLSGSTTVLGLVAGTSKRPRIQFSENAGDAGPNSGMSIEYNGTGQGIGNELYINGTTNNRLFTFKNSGFFSLGTNNPKGAIDVAIPNADVYLTDDTNGTVDNNSGSLFLPGHIFLAPFSNSTNISYVQARREDNSGSTQLNIRTTNSGVITEAVQIKNDGDVDIKGFVKLGSTAPAIKMIKVIGTTSTGLSGQSMLAHPVVASKIISVTGVIENSAIGYRNASDYVLIIWDIGSTSLRLINKTAEANWHNKQITITIVYEQ